MRARVKISKGDIVFSSEPAKRFFFEKNEGKDAILEIDDAPTANSRRYFEGALIPAIFYQHPNSGWRDFSDTREAIKLEFYPGYTKDIKGNRVKIPRSTTELSKERFTGLIDLITRWMVENGLTIPDSTDYIIWRDSAPPQGETYPPLKRMIELYEKQMVIKCSAKVEKK